MSNLICFSEDTLVITPEGLKKISLLNIEDKIFSYNFNEEIVEITTIKKKVNSMHTNIFKIYFRNNKDVLCTEDHPFWVKGKGWSSINPKKTFDNYDLKVAKIELNDACFYFDGEDISYIEVTKIETLKKKLNMYNISDNKNCCFFANNFLVHDENIMNIKGI